MAFPSGLTDCVWADNHVVGLELLPLFRGLDTSHVFEHVGFGHVAGNDAYITQMRLGSDTVEELVPDHDGRSDYQDPSAAEQEWCEGDQLAFAVARR